MPIIADYLGAIFSHLAPLQEQFCPETRAELLGVTSVRVLA